MVVSLNWSYSQEVYELSYSPEYPTLEDTIVINYGVLYNNYGCAQDSIHMEKLAFGQYLLSSYTCCDSPGPMGFYWMTDTVQIYPGLFVPGYVDVFFQVGYLTDSNCPEFPVSQSGDTIAYPTEIQFIEIPVGYYASVDEGSSEAIEVYPNPTNDVLNISLQDQGLIVADILSIDGQLITQVTVYNNQIVISDLTSGQYILSIVGEGRTFHSKFIKL